MKRLFIIATVLVAGGVLAAPNISREIGPTSTVIFPERPVQEAPVWTNGTPVVNGQLIRGRANGSFYMAVTAGTSTNRPSHGWGDNSTDDAVTWYHVPRGRRNGFETSLMTSGTVFVTKGEVSSVNGGINLPQYGWSAGLDNDGYQGKVTGISSAGTTNTIGGDEW